MLRNIVAVRELLGLTGGVGYFHSGYVLPFFLGREAESKHAGCIQGLLFFQHHRAITLYPDAHAGSGQAVAGITLDSSAHGDLTARGIMFRNGIKSQIKGGLDKLVYIEIDILIIFHAQCEQSSPDAGRNYKLT